MRPYLHFLRVDRWGYPLVYPVGTFMVMAGADRRETGTHYTPKSLTEAIVKETMEPLVYVGPEEGKPREDWIAQAARRTARPENLRSRDGLRRVSRSGMPLVVRAARSRHGVQAESTGRAITAEGEVVDEIGGLEPLRGDAEDRVLTARRLIAERCLYGVDVNPLAVELAKLSIWLITLAKGRPFGFLDHNLRCGDSLLGIHDLDQLLYLDMATGKGSSKKLFASKIDQAVQEAVALRLDLRRRPIRDICDVEVMASLDEKARENLELPQLIADALIGEMISGYGKGVDTTGLSIEAGSAIEGDETRIGALRRRAREGLSPDLSTANLTRRPFNWPLEFPEVLNREQRWL